MGMQCEVCGKKPCVGNHYAHRGKAKYLGGVGRKVTRHQPPHLPPNLQSIQCQVGGSVQRMRVCVQCIRSGRVQRPQRAPAVPDADQPVASPSPESDAMSLTAQEVQWVAHLARPGADRGRAGDDDPPARRHRGLRRSAEAGQHRRRRADGPCRWRRTTSSARTNRPRRCRSPTPWPTPPTAAAISTACRPCWIEPSEHVYRRFATLKRDAQSAASRP